MQTPEKIKEFQFTSVIWDWNGTLLNDTGLCVGTINILLEKRGLPLLSNKKYREIFSFPVKGYYEKAGFDFSKEDFAIPAKEYIDKYNAKVNQCTLQPGAIGILDFFRMKNISQFVLSAMQQDMLEETLNFQRISGFFRKISGLNDHYAVSKVTQGKRLLDEMAIEKSKACIIGDTLHDFEVAEELGITCILIANGHQSKERLKKSGALVLDSLEELAEALRN